jgi:hypothetical protein
MTDTTKQNESAEPDQDASEDLRDERYCEVIPVTTTDGVTLTSWVYNTSGLNLCPADQWDALTEEEVNEEYGSIAAKLNGPRFWVMDKLVGSGSSLSDESVFFGGIEMRLRAQSTTNAGDATVGEVFYIPNEVKRDTVYTYKGGKLVYELTSPDNQVYVMQSYAQIKDKDLSLADLVSLEEKLSLPDGWSYSPRELTEDLVLDSGGLAYVINDDLYNSYQRRT